MAVRRLFPLTALTLLAIPLIAAVPATRLKEPNAVFAFDIDAAHDRFTAVLFDRANKKALEHADISLEYPPYGIGGINDAIQFSPATKKIYVGSLTSTPGSPDVGMGGDHDTRIVEGGFTWKDPVDVFSCSKCQVIGWIVHPTQPKLYVAIKDEFTVDEFRNAKLAEITLSPKLRTRVIGRIPAASQGIAITPDGGTIYAFGEAEKSDYPYGELVSIRLSDRKRTKTVVNFPREDSFGMSLHANTHAVSPDMREVVYPNSVLDVRTRKTEEVLKADAYEGMNGVIAWSRDSRKLFFPLAQAKDVYGVAAEASIVFDRTTKKTWNLPLLDADILDWSPAQTAILFLRGRNVGFYDLENREWVEVLEGGSSYAANGAWVTMPTKKVPKR